MDPYLEHPVLWEGLHARLVVAIANRLQPMLDPRYVATVEERVYIEGLQRRVPDVWIQRVEEARPSTAVLEPQAPGVVVVEVEELEVHESRVEILDAYNDMKLVTLIEVLSPTNKLRGPGRESYLRKQEEILERDCHLVEIDVLRTGEHTLCVPEWRVQELEPFEYLSCVNRWPRRTRFELYPSRLRSPLPEIGIPLAAPDADVLLPLQSILEQVYDDGRYYRRVRYEESCNPALSDDDQQWAWDRWRVFQQKIVTSEEEASK